MKAFPATAAASLALLCCAQSFAQPYPNKPIRLVIPYTAGSSSNDILGRALALRMSDALGQQVVIDNRPGAGGNLGSEMVAKAPPDGYTLLVATNGPQAISPSVYAKLGYDSEKDLAPVAMLAMVPYVVVANPSMGATNIRELIALAKAKPGQINFGSSGTGGTPHLCGEMLKSMGGVDMVHVPYKGGSLAVIDVMAGQVQFYCPGLAAVVQQVKTGKLRALGMATLKRSALMPELPTVAEQGLPGFDAASWFGIMAPAKTPRAVIDRLYKDLAAIVESADMKNFILAQGAEPALMDPAQFAKHLHQEIIKWRKVVKSANVPLQ